jgi:hypothetical protein
MWDVTNVPLGLRRDIYGKVGTFIAHAANRCAVGTSIMRRRRVVNGDRIAQPV